jgi:hypothetical protein
MLSTVLMYDERDYIYSPYSECYMRWYDITVVGNKLSNTPASGEDIPGHQCSSFSLGQGPLKHMKKASCT